MAEMKQMLRSLIKIERLILLSPLIFILHVAEEAPGFVVWFNSLVERGISQRLFLTVNISALVITVFIATAVAIAKTKGAVILALSWLSFLMFANALLHIVGTMAHDRYSPGVITAMILYLPYFLWFLYRSIRQYSISTLTASIVIVSGSLPMLIHGYLIVFEGGRLF
jgi:hypothetical protein